MTESAKKFDPLAFGFALVGTGLDIFGNLTSANAQYEAQRQAIEQQNFYAQMERNYQNLQIQRQNQYAAEAYEIQKGIAQQQIALNNEAAERSYYGAAINRERQLTSLAFNRENLAAELMEAVGSNAAAIEGDNRSAELAAAKETYGRYGRMDEQIKLQARNIAQDEKLANMDTYTQNKAANLQAHASVAIPPYMQSQLPPAYQAPMPGAPSTLNSALMIGNELIGGYQMYNTLSV